MFDKIMAIGIQELSCEISWIRMEIRYDSFDSLNLTTIIVKVCHNHITKYTHLLTTKGQLISECLFGAFNFRKKNPQKFDEFLL